MIIRSGYSTRKRNGSTRAHRKARAQVLAEEFACWICGLPARYGDPLEADHIVPWVDGGADVRANMRAAHRSCNLERSSRRLA